MCGGMSFPLPPRSRLNLSHFDVGKEIGDGSLSTVRIGTEVATGKAFALKVFNRQYLRSQKKEADVTMEEHCLRRINHPGIVKLYASFRDEVSHYLVLELCPGGELWAMVKEIGCSDRTGRHYLSQVLEAVMYLHDATIVHRDLKAENVLVDSRGAMKLVDFGTAKDLANPHIKGAGTPSFKTVLEDNVGTPNFMAPEAIKNKFTDARSDVWSLGCTIFQVLSGLPPFGTDVLNVYRRALKTRRGACTLQFPPGFSEVARDLVQRMVVFRPNSRLGAAGLRDVRNHAFFRPSPTSHGRADLSSAHHRPAPVDSLEECCLKVVHRSWSKLQGRACELVGLQDSRLRPEAQAMLKRIAEVMSRGDEPEEKSTSSGGAGGGD